MKNKIKDALKAEYKNLGFSDKAIDGVAEYLTTSIKEEAEIETGIKGLSGLLKAFQSDTDKVRSEKAALEKKVAELEGKANPDPDPPKGKKEEGKDEPPAWAKEMIEANKKLQEKLAAIEGEKTASSRKTQLQEAIKAAPQKFKERYEKDFSRLSFKDDEEYASWLEEVKTDAAEFATLAAAKPGVFKTPKGGQETPPADKIPEEVQERIKAREAEPVASAIAGLPKTN